MFENHMLQMYDTREIELRARMGERRVDLVPPFRSTGPGLVARVVKAVRAARRRAQAGATRPAVPSVPCP
ncbi:MAG TPA: hypothetical protein VLS51_08350 [Propionibacteriaceae bacterium]|nr:hypothetical protein [Propionibacteriaceae bacterium]